MQLSQTSRVTTAAVAAGTFGLAAAFSFVAVGVTKSGPTAASAASPVTVPSVVEPATGPPPASAVDSYPALKSPDPARALSIEKPTGISLFIDNEPGLDVAHATVLRDTASTSLVLIPKGDGQLCLVRLQASGAATNNCVSYADAEKRGIVDPLPGAAFGVLPREVTAVSFTLSDGTKETVDVDSDGYFEAPAEATSAEFVRGSGTVSLGTLVPESRVPDNVIISK